MKTKRSQIMTAGALLLATALAGAAARGAGPASIGEMPAKGKATFAAPTTGPVTFTGTLDRTAVLLGRDGRARMELVLAAAPNEAAPSLHRPADVVVILDRSGSMAGEKIAHARDAVRALLAQLGPQDRFALVTYSDDARVVLPLSSVEGGARTAWDATIAEVQAGGGTNMSSGLDVGIDLVERGRVTGRVPHVLVISDGLANLGDPSPEGLMQRARRAAQGEYMLSTIGVGADFNEYLMTALADAGTGNYYYLQNSADLATVFAREFDAARTTVAPGLAVQIQPGSGVRVLDAAGYPLETTGGAVVFRPGSLFAGQQRRIWVTLAVPQDVVGDYDLGRFSLSYGEPPERTTLSFSEVPRVTCVQSEKQFYSSIDTGAWARSVTIDSYNKMRGDIARDVQAGQPAQALKRLREFKEETAAMNEHLKSPPVAAQLHSLDTLDADVTGAFVVGPDQARLQNELSKSTSADAIDARRAGSKK